MSRSSWNRVAWPEGMFLLPQHLQQLDAGAEARLARHLRLVDPFHWGVFELEVEPEALASAQISIPRLLAVLPDGTILDCPDGAPIETRKFDPTVEELAAYVGIRQLRPAEAAFVDEDRRDRHARYWMREVDVADQGQPGEKSPVPFLFPNVRVFVSGEEAELDGYDVFKLMEIEATGVSGQPYRVRPTFAPPLLKLEAWGPLHERVQAIVHQMTGKLRLVAAMRASLTKLDTARVMLAYTLGRMAPVLEHQLGTGQTHPFTAYSALIETAAGLSALGGDPGMELPRYDHEDPYRCYAVVLDFIHAELEREFRDRSTEVRLPYAAAHGAYAVQELGRELTDPGNTFFLAVKAEIERAELSRLVTAEARAGALSQLPFFSAHAVRALTLEPLPAPPLDVEPRPGFEFFAIDPRSHATWKRVVDEHSFGVRLGPLQEADVRLFVVQPEA